MGKYFLNKVKHHENKWCNENEFAVEVGQICFITKGFFKISIMCGNLFSI